MTKYNVNNVLTDMKAQLEFLMNIYNRLMISDQDVAFNTTTVDYRSLNGYIKLMQCATNSKKYKKLNKSRLSRPTTANRTINITSTIHKNYKCYSGSSSVSSHSTLSQLPSSELFDFENNSISNCFEETKRLLWVGCKTVDDALDMNRDLPLWVQLVDSNNIVKQLLTSVNANHVDKGNLQTLVSVFIHFSITMINMFGMNASVDQHWWKKSFKIMEQLINYINVHCRAKNPNTSLKVKAKNSDKLFNKVLSTITLLKKFASNDNKVEAHMIQNPITPLVPPVQQPVYQTPSPDYNAQQYVNYNYFNQNGVGSYNYEGLYQMPQINRPLYCPMQYYPQYQPAYQQYSNQVQVNQPQHYQYLQQLSTPWQNNYQKPQFPIYNAPFPPTQFVTNPQSKFEAKLFKMKEDDDKKWFDAQKKAKKLVQNLINHNVSATRSVDSTQSSQESEEGLISNIHPSFETLSDRDRAPLPDYRDRMWNFLNREVDKKVRYKFQKMIREIQIILKEELIKKPELYVTTYQNVVMIQLFEPIRCKMINKTYENVQEVIRDFRLVFSTFRHTSQKSNDIKCKLMMDFMEHHFNICLRKFFRGWNLEKYHSGVIDILFQ